MNDRTRDRPRSLFVVGIAASVLAAAAAAQVDRPPPTLEDPTIILSVNEETGVRLPDFLKLAEQITGKRFTFPAEDVQAAPNIRIVGEVRLRRSEFFPFVQGVLRHQGFDCHPGQDDTQDATVVELVLEDQADRRRTGGMPFVPLAHIGDYRSRADVHIATSIQLEHLALDEGLRRVEPFFARGETPAEGLRLVRVGSSRILLARGPGSEVFKAWRLLDLIDVAERREGIVARTVELRHASAQDVAQRMRGLLLDSRPEVAIVAAKAGAVLFVAGEVEAVRSVVEVISLLDTPERER